MLAIKSGAPIWNKNSILIVIQKVYQDQILIQKVPDDGDCYFHSIGVNTNETAKQVREKIAKEIVMGSDYEINIISECKGKRLYDVFKNEIQTLSQIVRIMCNENKGKDCEECLWGSSTFNGIVQDIYQRPVVVFEIDPHDLYIEDQEQVVTVDRIKFKDVKNRKLFEKIYNRLLNDQDNQQELEFQITNPKFRVILNQSSLIDPIGLLFHISHYNAFILK